MNSIRSNNQVRNIKGLYYQDSKFEFVAKTHFKYTLKYILLTRKICQMHAPFYPEIFILLIIIWKLPVLQENRLKKIINFWLKNPEYENTKSIMKTNNLICLCLKGLAEYVISGD